MSKDGQQSDSKFYCDLKAKELMENPTVSTSSGNSTECIQDIDNDRKLLECQTVNQCMTGSQSNDNSEQQCEENNDSKENFLRPSIKQTVSGSATNTRKTASWEVITKKDVANAQLEELDLQNTLNTSVTGSKLTQVHGQSSSHGQILPSSQSNFSSQSSEEAGGRAGKLMSTFSNLKKIRIGKKQGGDQSSSGAKQPPVVRTYFNSFVYFVVFDFLVQHH